MEPTNRPVIRIHLSKTLAYLLAIISYLPAAAFIALLIEESLSSIGTEVVIVGLIVFLVPGLLISWLVKSYKNDKKLALVFATMLITIYIIATAIPMIRVIDDILLSQRSYGYDVYPGYSEVRF